MILSKALTQAVTSGWRDKTCKADSEGILASSGLLNHSGKLSCIFQHTFKVVSLILLKLNTTSQVKYICNSRVQHACGHFIS